MKLKIFVWMIVALLVLQLSIATLKVDLETALHGFDELKLEMEAAGLGVERINDLIAEGLLYLKESDYNKTQTTISDIYSLKDKAFATKKEFEELNNIYLVIKEKNISLVNATNLRVELDLASAERALKKENYEEANIMLSSAEEIILLSITSKYNYLDNLILSVEGKIISLGLSEVRITAIKSLFSESLETGDISLLEVVKEEVESMGLILVLYEEIQTNIPVLESNNLSSQRVKDELHSASVELSLIDYDSATERLENLKLLVENILVLESEISEFISNADVKPFEHVNSTVQKSKHELILGNYEDAKNDFVLAKKEYEDYKAGFLVKTGLSNSAIMKFKEFFQINAKYILFVGLLMVFAAVLFYYFATGWIRIKKLEISKKNLSANEEMIKEIQRNYFSKKRISRDSYNESYDFLQEKIIKLKERIALLNKKIKKDKK